MTQRHTDRSRRQDGFTLIEIMVVIVILGILAGVVSFGVIRYIDDARVKQAKIQITNLKSALQAFSIDTGSYPTQEEGLQALIEPPTDERAAKLWKGPYLESDEVPDDPWGNEYFYQVSEYPGTGAQRVEIISYGKDRAQGGEGYNADISSRKLAD